MNAINTLVADVLAEQTGIVEGTVTSEEKAAAVAGTLPSQTVAAPAQGGSHNPMEKVYQDKYPHLKIVPGSMVQDTSRGGDIKFANKVRVMVVCNSQLTDGPRCTEVVERATSDLHTFLGCEGCKKVIKKLNKAKKALAEHAKN